MSHGFSELSLGQVGTRRSVDRLVKAVLTSNRTWLNYVQVFAMLKQPCISKSFQAFITPGSEYFWHL